VQVFAPQGLQAVPPVPQAELLVPARQPEGEQQPFGQETLSHAQAPATQRRPAVHAMPLPHWQFPRLEQPSAVRLLHATQVPPPVPQLATPGL
jgi:hypothetical protein